jgi:ubiquinone/menaquinone biosynthesis C-methylase UbiE
VKAFLATTAALVALAAAMPSGSQSQPPKPQQHGRLFPPTDLGLLEMPDRDLWQLPEQIMDVLGIAEASVVADVGAGSGWFTVRLARRVGPNGRVFSQDVQSEMLNAISRRVLREGLTNVTPIQGYGSDPRLPSNTLDGIVLVGVYYEIADKITMLRNLGKALKPQGRIGVIDFKLQGGGPGPPMEERIDPKIVVRDAAAAGLQLLSQETFLPYQYLLVFSKAAASTSKPTAAPRSPKQP